MSELNAALRRANAVIYKYNSDLSIYDKKTHSLEPVPLVKFEQKYPVGTGVQTVYGKGLVVRFRPFDGMNEVHIPVYASIAVQDKQLSESGLDFTDPVAVQNMCTKDMQYHICYLRNADIDIINQTVHKSIFTIHYPSKNLDRLREVRVNETSFAAKNLDPFYDRDRHEDIIGCLVYTAYGVGRVCGYRKSDGVYTVALKYGVMYISNKLVRISDIPPPRDIKSRSNSWDITAAVKGVLPNTSMSISSSVLPAASAPCAEGKNDHNDLAVQPTGGGEDDQSLCKKHINAVDDEIEDAIDNNVINITAIGHSVDKDNDESNYINTNGSSSNNNDGCGSNDGARIRIDSNDYHYVSAATNRE